MASVLYVYDAERPNGPFGMCVYRTPSGSVEVGTEEPAGEIKHKLIMYGLYYDDMVREFRKFEKTTTNAK